MASSSSAHGPRDKLVVLMLGSVAHDKKDRQGSMHARSNQLFFKGPFARTGEINSVSKRNAHNFALSVHSLTTSADKLKTLPFICIADQRHLLLKISAAH